MTRREFIDTTVASTIPTPGAGAAFDDVKPAPIGRRLEVYSQNPFYFYDPEQGRPVFLSGQLDWTSICTPRLWYSHSPQAFGERYNNRDDAALDPDKVAEYLALRGGNCCRLATCYGDYGDTPNKTSGPIYRPWARTSETGGRTSYDLLKFDHAYWRRFRHYLGLLQQKRIYVLLEVFPSLWGFENQPICPEKNINYTKEDLPAQLDWYLTVRGGSRKVLEVQEAFVRKAVSESLSFRNVLYVINNQYLSDSLSTRARTEEILMNRESTMAWPRYWARFIKDIGRSRGETPLVGTMPRFHSADSARAAQFQWYVDDDLLDFADAGWWRLHPAYPEYGLGETEWMEKFDDMPLRDRVALFARSLGSWYAYQDKREKKKPLILSKALFWDGVLRHSPWPMWAGFASGYALASPHEPMSRSYWHPPRYEATAEVAGHLHRFIRESAVEFWKMKPMPGIAFGLGQDAYVLGNPGQEYVVYLVGEANGPLSIQLPKDEYIVEYYDPKTGQWVDTRLIPGGSPAEVFVHECYSEFALLIQRREKRESIMKMRFPS